MSYCKVIILGNLTRDVELRYSQRGTAVGSFDVATNRKWKTEAGEDREEVCFTPVTAWGKQAETIAQYLRKGDPILVEGRLALETWEDKNGGGKRSKLKVVVESFSFVGSRKERGGSEQSQEEPPKPRTGYAPTARDLARGQRQEAPTPKEGEAPQEEDDVQF